MYFCRALEEQEVNVALFSELVLDSSPSTATCRSNLVINHPGIVRKAIFEILDNQLADGDPPETRETLARLVAEGHSEEEARRLIALVAASEMVAVIQEGREFDGVRYAEALRALPKLPW